VPFDEKWSYVGCKDKNHEPDDPRSGACGDHTAIDPESRLLVSLVIGKPTAEATHALVPDFRVRTGGRVMRLMTSDEHAPYTDAIRAAYGRWVEPEPTGRPGRPRNPYLEVPPEVTYATVHDRAEEQ
jgi:hypothetical protein